MGDKPFNPINYVRAQPLLETRTLRLQRAWHDGREVYRIDPPTLFLNWDEGNPTTYTIDYPGDHGLLFVPFSGIFTAVGTCDRVFELIKGSRNTLTLEPKADIKRAGFPTNGTLRFSYAIYDFEFDSFAIGHSPPDMLLGP